MVCDERGTFHKDTLKWLRDAKIARKNDIQICSDPENYRPCLQNVIEQTRNKQRMPDTPGSLSINLSEVIREINQPRPQL